MLMWLLSQILPSPHVLVKPFGQTLENRKHVSQHSKTCFDTTESTRPEPRRQVQYKKIVVLSYFAHHAAICLDVYFRHISNHGGDRDDTHEAHTQRTRGAYFGREIVHLPLPLFRSVVWTIQPRCASSAALAAA